MVAFSPALYLTPVWNRLDALLVLLSTLDFVLFIMPSNGVAVIRVGRMKRLFRLLRVLRLVRMFKGFQTVIHMIVVLQMSQQGLFHVGTVVLFVFYVYAYLCVIIFGKVCPHLPAALCMLALCSWSLRILSRLSGLHTT